MWDDIEKILKLKTKFFTIKSKTPFTVQFDSHGETRIIILKEDRTFYLYRDQLLDLWQQIRNYGFSNSKIIPNGLSKNISYIFPIFNELEYLKLTELSDSFTGISNNPSIGIQYLGQKKENNKQLSLF